jgi:predicted AlkP superfamily pyrophosphatase or phosphodiesterase
MGTLLFRGLAALALALAAPAAADAPEKPKLIVTLVVDQFAADLFQQYRPTYTGGLKRVSQGVAFVNGYQSHAVTETCPGHSTILTGRHPSATGIVGNNWFDRQTGKWLYCVAVKGAGRAARGPQNLKVDTLGAWLKGAEPAARVVSVSGKDRAAIMLAGHKADAVYWWGGENGFTTSAFAGPTGHDVTRPEQRFNKALLAKWKRRPPALWPAASAPCAALGRPETFGEVTLSGHLPPDASVGVEQGADYLRSGAFHDQLHASPLLDRVTLDFAERLIDARRLGRGKATDLLAVSLSATDYIGHRYGKGGPEMCANIQALDRELGAFFAKLDSLRVSYLVMLTADHGSLDAVERRVEHGLDGQRLDGAAFVRDLNAHLRQVFGIDYDPVAAMDPQELTIEGPSDGAFREKLESEALAWLGKRPEIEQVLTRQQVIAAAPGPEKPVERLAMAERFHESFDPGRSGDIFVVLKKYTSPSVPRKPADAVAGHGSPWDYDRLVPILFWWPGVQARQVDRPIETVDIAPTLAAVAEVPAPPLDGRCLGEIAKCTAPRPAARPASAPGSS